MAEQQETRATLGTSSRILNCAQVSHDIEQRERRKAPELLLFKSRIFNESVFIKDRPPVGLAFEGTVESRERRRTVATKIFMPYDPDRPAAGGRTVFYGTPQLTKAMA
ncbi:hypothetical protein [Roseiterribacter gracilis]|uniref:Uncharacterized protein n=1 Tax=Roseiterribacter gracilis TaxID=2812848 RepID=A0A8S8XCX5_9PROT|nr:hypothetical protein TMPK1_13130 [Rhodospirillales bacterium TMPK1]